MEVYAGFTAQSDHEIGRVIDAIAATGQLDNTLIVYIAGDNGASMEGGLYGTSNLMAQVNGVPEDTAAMLAHLDELGGPHTDAALSGRLGLGRQRALPMGQAYRLSPRRNARSHGRLLAQAHQRRRRHSHQFEARHRRCADHPRSRRRSPRPLKSTASSSSASTASACSPPSPHATAPETRTTQYFEMMGNRAIYHDGWIAAARSGLLPWVYASAPDTMRQQPWELYNLANDYSEADNLAAQYPDKLKQLAVPLRPRGEAE